MGAEQLFAGAAGQSEIADRENMRGGVARLGVPAAVAESVELLDIAEVEPGLPLHPGAQADLEGAVGARGERAEGKRVPFARPHFAGAHHENMRLLLAHADDRGIEPKLDLGAADCLFCGAKGLSHGSGRIRGQSSANTCPSSAIAPRPMPLDGGDHAPLTGKHLIAKSHQPAVGIGGGRGSAQRSRQAESRRRPD